MNEELSETYLSWMLMNIILFFYAFGLFGIWIWGIGFYILLNYVGFENYNFTIGFFIILLVWMIWISYFYYKSRYGEW